MSSWRQPFVLPLCLFTGNADLAEMLPLARIALNKGACWPKILSEASVPTHTFSVQDDSLYHLADYATRYLLPALLRHAGVVCTDR